MPDYRAFHVPKRNPTPRLTAPGKIVVSECMPVIVSEIAARQDALKSLLAELKLEFRTPEPWPKERTLMTFAEEFGHALDEALGDFSSSPVFRSAYMQDIARLSPEEQQQYQYYLKGTAKDPRVIGRQEVFANAFAELTNGQDRREGLQIRTTFPRSTELVHTLLEAAQADETWALYAQTHSKDAQRIKLMLALNLHAFG